MINGLKVAADKKKWTDLTLKDAVGNKLVVYDGANDLAKAEPIAATLYQKDSESTGVKVDISEADKAEYSYANGILTWNGEPGQVLFMTHDVQLHHHLYSQLGCCNQDIQGNCNKKSTVNIRAKIESIV